MIYRQLLKHDGKIEPNEMRTHRIRDPARPSYEDRVQLSSQLASTCQQVYWDTQHTLYEENTLSIVVQRDRHDEGRFGGLFATRCYALDLVTCIPHSLNTVPVIADLTTCAARSLQHARDRTLNNAWPALLRFKEVHLTIDLAHTLEVFIAAYLIRNLLMEEHVTLSLTRAEEDYSAPFIGRLSCCRWLRCQTIMVENIPAGEDISHITEYIESGKPICDILPLWLELKRVLDTYFIDYPNEGLLRWLLDDTYVAAEAAVFEHDLDKFSRLREEILTTATKDKREWVEAKVERVKFTKAALVAEATNDAEIDASESKADTEIASIREEEKEALEAAARIMVRQS